MKAFHTLERPVPSPGFRAAIRRLALATLCLVLAACGGSADAPPPPESVPLVITQPADQSVVAGSAAIFSVSASGAAPLSYQWASSPDGITFTDVVGATAASYNTGATTLAQNGTRYRVKVSNSLGSVSSSAALLTVTPLVVGPAITMQPVDQTVTTPATATFNVTASGTALTYQWQVSSDSGVTFNAVPGGPSAPTLAVINTLVAQSGQRYRVVVSNSAGSATSSSALLTVLPAPVAPLFTTQPLSQTIVVGQAVTFTVAATGTPAPTIQWRINGANLVDGLQASGACAGATAAGAVTASLTLTAVPLGCSGAVFSAVASNGVNPNAVSNGATLTVNPLPVPPVVTLQPVDATVLAPATATFTAAASGVPSPTVQWQQSIDAGVTWTNINGATNTSFTTPATVPADSGKRFRAVFTNTAGIVNSNAATLTVTMGTIAAGLASPTGIAIDAAGNLYIAEVSNQTIVEITPLGVVSTLAGLAGSAGSADGTGSAARFNGPYGVAVDGAGNVYDADSGSHTIRKITAAGVVTTLAGLAANVGSVDGTGSAARFRYPSGVAVDATGNVFVADHFNFTIREVTPAGVVTTLAGLAGVGGSTDGTGSAARFNGAYGVAADGAGNVYVADSGSHTIRKITPAGVVTTLAGLATISGSADGTGSAARFLNPNGIAADVAGNVYVADTFNHTIRKVTPAGVVTTLAGLAGSPGSVDGTGSAARFFDPNGIAVDGAGNLYVADTGNKSIRKITPAGVVSTYAQ